MSKQQLKTMSAAMGGWSGGATLYQLITLFHITLIEIVAMALIFCIMHVFVLGVAIDMYITGDKK